MSHVRLFGVCCDLIESDRTALNVQISEYAVLDDGTRVHFSLATGFSVSRSVGVPLTVEFLEEQVRAALATDSGGCRPWDQILFILSGHGVSTLLEELPGIPLAIEYSDELLGEVSTR